MDEQCLTDLFHPFWVNRKNSAEQFSPSHCQTGPTITEESENQPCILEANHWILDVAVTVK